MQVGDQNRANPPRTNSAGDDDRLSAVAGIVNPSRGVFEQDTRIAAKHRKLPAACQEIIFTSFVLILPCWSSLVWLHCN